MANLDSAIRLAARVHSGQKDIGGDYYILHPLRLMLRMETETERIAAVLHDVVEDTELTLEDLNKEGFSAEVIEAVDFLSRRTTENYEEYIERLKGHPLARKIKIADLEDNMNLKRLSTLGKERFEKLLKLHRAWAMLKKLENSAE